MWKGPELLQSYPIWIPSVDTLIDGRGIDQSDSDWPMFKPPYEFKPTEFGNLKALDRPIMSRIQDLTNPLGEFEKPSNRVTSSAELLPEYQKLTVVSDGAKLSEAAAEVYEMIHSHRPDTPWWSGGKLRKSRSGGNIVKAFKIETCSFEYGVAFLKYPAAMKVGFAVSQGLQSGYVEDIFELPTDIKPSKFIPFIDQVGYHIRYLYYETILTLRLMGQGLPIVD